MSLALSGGVALHAINLYVSITILPSVVRDIGGLEYYAWSTTMFVVTSILGTTLSSRLLAWTGPRGGYAFGAGVFATGSAMCALAPTMAVMLVGRSVQGLGGGVLLALAYVMVRRVYAEPLWPRAFAMLSSLWGVATLLGPTVGGVFAELGFWRDAFGWLALVALLFIGPAMRVLPERGTNRPQANGGSLPWRQLVLLVGAVVAASCGSLANSVTEAAGSISIAVILLHALVRLEMRSNCRLLPRQVFRGHSRIGRLYALSALMAVTVTCTEIFLPLFLQEIHGFSPLVAGYIAAIMSAGWTLAAVISVGLRGRPLDRAIQLGPILSLVSLVALASALPISRAEETGAPIVILLALVMGGMGVGFVYPHLCTRIMQAATEGEADQTSSAIMTLQLCATAFGAAIAGLVVNVSGSVDSSGVFNAANASRWLFAVVALAPIACISLMWKERK